VQALDQDPEENNAPLKIKSKKIKKEHIDDKSDSQKPVV